MLPVSSAIVIVGMGQLGSTFAEGFLKLGRPVVPVLRGDNLARACDQAEPEAVLIATGEDDLAPCLGQLPPAYRSKVILIQNELRPDQWTAHEDMEPTVAIVWFEKKKGKLPHVVLPSLLYGPLAALMSSCFERIDLPAERISTSPELAHHLVLKNLYILGLNLTGMRVGGTAGELLEEHRAIFDSVIDEILRIEGGMLASAPGFSHVELDVGRLLEDLRGAIAADPGHGCAGRSAPRRLQRTLAHADHLGLRAPVLQSLKETVQ